MEDLKHGPVTEFEKIAILHLSAVGFRRFEIFRTLNRSKPTVRLFQASYEKSGKLFHTRDRPPNEPIPWDFVEDIMHALRPDPRLTLREEVSRFGLQSLNRQSYGGCAIYIAITTTKKSQFHLSPKATNSIG
jgi:hypothetical protein